MDSDFTPNQDAPFNDDFNLVGGEIFASFSPWASWLSDGNPFAPSASPSLATPAGSAATQGDPGSIVAVTSGGITINLIFDAAALAAPASFRAGIQQAVSILAAAISDKITVNLKIDYSGTGGGAAAGPDHGVFQSYSSIRADLINNATPGDTTFNALTAGSSIQGQSSVAVWNAQLKLWGLMAANDTTTDDGSATFATDINPNLLVGVALHELTHAMGRVPYGTQPDIFDLYRFTGAGTRLFQGGATAPAAYFSLDGGNTKVADYGRTSDASDFLNSGVQGPSDPFNEFYTGSTSQQLTAADLKQLDALGFHLMGAQVPKPAPVLIQQPGQMGSDWHIATAADFDGDGTADILWTRGGDAALWTMKNGALSAFSASTQGHMGPEWTAVSANGDFNNDGRSDVLWTNHAAGSIAIWEMNGANLLAFGAPATSLGAGWQVRGVGDFDADGKSDILWVSDTNQVSVWSMNGTSAANMAISNGHMGMEWTLGAVGNFGGNGHDGAIWENSSGDLVSWSMNGATLTGLTSAGHMGPAWHIAGVGDFNKDGTDDLVWVDAANDVDITLIKGNQVSQIVTPSGHMGQEWQLKGAGDFTGDGGVDLLWERTDGTTSVWDMRALAATSAAAETFNFEGLAHQQAPNPLSEFSDTNPYPSQPVHDAGLDQIDHAVHTDAIAGLLLAHLFHSDLIV